MRIAWESIKTRIAFVNWLISECDFTEEENSGGLSVVNRLLAADKGATWFRVSPTTPTRFSIYNVGKEVIDTDLHPNIVKYIKDYFRKYPNNNATLYLDDALEIPLTIKDEYQSKQFKATLGLLKGHTCTVLNSFIPTGIKTFSVHIQLENKREVLVSPKTFSKNFVQI